MRLGKIRPISHQAVFSAVNANGYRVADQNFMLRYLPSASLPSTARYQPGFYYLGFKINRKFDNAVKRNKMRRRCRAIYYNYVHHVTCKLKPGYLIVIPRHRSKEASFVELAYSFTKSLGNVLNQLSSDNRLPNLQI